MDGALRFILKNLPASVRDRILLFYTNDRFNDILI